VPMLRKLRSVVGSRVTRSQRRQYSKWQEHFDPSWTFTEVMQNLPSENERYRYFVSWFDNEAPNWLREHRAFFVSEKRGFGEDAFHAMWMKLLEQERPKNIVEIGVYRGQSLSLLGFLASGLEPGSEVWGVSPMSSLGDSVSVYSDSVDYLGDVCANYEKFCRTLPNLIVARSQDAIAEEFLKSWEWDLFYVDGSHDYCDVQRDIDVAAETLRPNGLLVMDDASLYRKFRAPRFAFAGHPGPSKVASDLATGEVFQEIGTCGHNRVFRKK